LATLGYVHCGTLGVEGREAFESPDGLAKHNLYVCPQESPSLANHLALRHYLRSHPDTAREYGELKKQLAQQYPHDSASYVEGKTDLILRILRDAGLRPVQLEAVELSNRSHR